VGAAVWSAEAVLADAAVCPAALAPPVDAALGASAGGGPPGTGREAWAGANTARSARSAAAMRGS